MLEAVIVTGVQEETSRGKVGFDVAHVDVANLPVASVDPLRTLQGKIGANIVSGSGRPGTQPAVLLRGPTMLNATGRSQDPLYIVDGVIINGNLPEISPNDIESVEVVKGAAAASLYGARAGNGVITISTKRGTRALEGVRFTFHSEAGMSDIERDFGIAHRQGLVTDASGTRFCQNVTGQPASRAPSTICTSSRSSTMIPRSSRVIRRECRSTPAPMPTAWRRGSRATG